MNGTIPSWNNFNFLPHGHNHVTTRTARIHVNESEWNQPPGKLFTPKIILFDQLGNHVSEQINVIIHQQNPPPSSPQHQQNKCNVKVETNPQFIVSENDTITLSLLGNNQPFKDPKQKCNFTVVVSLAWNNITSYTMRDRYLKTCYFGYTLINDRCQCQPLKNEAKGIAFCRNGEIFFYKNRWAYTKQKAFHRVCTTFFISIFLFDLKLSELEDSFAMI